VDKSSLGSLMLSFLLHQDVWPTPVVGRTETQELALHAPAVA